MDHPFVTDHAFDILHGEGKVVPGRARDAWDKHANPDAMPVWPPRPVPKSKPVKELAFRSKGQKPSPRPAAPLSLRRGKRLPYEPLKPTIPVKQVVWDKTTLNKRAFEIDTLTSAHQLPSISCADSNFSVSFDDDDYEDEDDLEVALDNVGHEAALPRQSFTDKTGPVPLADSPNFVLLSTVPVSSSYTHVRRDNKVELQQQKQTFSKQTKLQKAIPLKATLQQVKMLRADMRRKQKWVAAWREPMPNGSEPAISRPYWRPVIKRKLPSTWQQICFSRNKQADNCQGSTQAQLRSSCSGA